MRARIITNKGHEFNITINKADFDRLEELFSFDRTVTSIESLEGVK